MRHNYKFNKKIIDKDSDPRYVEPGKIIDTKNCMVTDSGKIESIEGNLQLGSILPSGHTCIGSRKYKDWIYYFSTNNTIHNIGRYNVKTSTNEVVNISNSNLNFNTDNPIDFIDLLDDDENDKLLMFWTDGTNPPRYYDWNNPPSFTFTEGYFDVIKPPPLREPTIKCIVSNKDVSISSSGYKGVNFISNKILRFGYRYIFEDGSVSAISFYSRSAFYHDAYKPVQRPESDTNILSNYFNGVEITVFISVPFSLDTRCISSVEVFAADVNTDNLYKIKTIEWTGTVIASVDFKFFNESTYPILTSVDAGKLFDNVPIKAKSQLLAENRLFYGNYTDGLSNNIVPNWKTEILGKGSFNAYEDYFGSIQSGSSEYVLNTQMGSIHKTDMFYFYAQVQNTTSGVNIEGLNVYIVVEDDYSDFNQLCASSNSGISELFSSKGFSLDTSVSDRVTISIDSPDNSFSNRFSIQKMSAHSILSLKKGEFYSYALCYYDDYNRSGGLIEHLEVEAHRYYQDSETYLPGRVAVVRIGHLAPTWAKKFKILRKEKKYTTARLEQPVAKTMAGEIYLGIPENSNPYIPDESLDIELLADTGTPNRGYTNKLTLYTPIKRFEVTDSTHAFGAGRWLVISEQETPGYTTADIIAVTTSLYNESIFLITVIKSAEDSVYKEIPGTYSIENRLHLVDFVNQNYGTEQSQTSECNYYDPGAFVKYLTYDGDVIYGQYGSLGYQIHSTSDGNIYSQLGRPQIASSTLRELNRESSVIYSELYNSETGFNGLSSFNTSLINFKDYPKRYGNITSLYYRDTDIIVFQKDKVINQPYNKNILELVGGSRQVTSTDEVLGVFTSYLGEYGLSNPESLAFRGGALFWVDANRGEVIRLSQNGLYPISKLGMRDYFRDAIITQMLLGERFKGYYDPHLDRYCIHIPEDGAWHFSIEDSGWTHLSEFDPDSITNDGLSVYSFKGIVLYKHNVISGDVYNTFYGSTKDISFKFAMNEGYSDTKTLHALYIEGDKVNVSIFDQEGDSTTILNTDFEDKEGSFYSCIPMNITERDTFSILGLGNSDTAGTGPGNIYVNMLSNFTTPQSGDIIRSVTGLGYGTFIDRNIQESETSILTWDYLIFGEYIVYQYGLKRTAGTDETYNSQARSKSTIGDSELVSWNVSPETGSGREKVIGLCNILTPTNYNDYQYAMIFYSNGDFSIYEGGVLKHTDTYNPGEYYRIRINFNSVRYDKSTDERTWNNIYLSLTPASGVYYAFVATYYVAPTCYFSYIKKTIQDDPNPWIYINVISGTFNNDFIYVERNSRIAGDNMRGNYFTCIGSNEGSEKVSIFAVDVEANKSEV